MRRAADGRGIVFGKKGMEISFVVGLVLVLLVAIAVVLVYTGVIPKILSFFSGVGPSQCSETYKQLSRVQFKEAIVMYGAKSSGVVSNYDPTLAIEYFKGYVACKEEPASMIRREEGNPAVDTQIADAAKAVYVNRANDLCTEFSKPDAVGDVQDAIKEEYGQLEDEYYEYFGGQKMTVQYGCQI